MLRKHTLPLLLLALLLSPFAAFADVVAPVKTPVYRCTIDTKNGTNTCQGLVTVSEQLNAQAKAKISLCSVVEKNKITEAEFAVHMGPSATGWLINVGDSATDNGWAGDWGDGTPTDPWQSGTESTGQSRDAEVQLNGNLAGTIHSWSAWGNDHTQNALDGHRRLFAEGNLDFSGKTVRIVARNEGADLSIDGDSVSRRVVDSPYMYALNNQSDFQGPQNCDLYLGVNRIIDGTYRTGSGVKSVDIVLYGQDVSTLSMANSYSLDDQLLALTSISTSLKLPASLSLKLDPATNKRLAQLLSYKGLSPTSVNTAMLGNSDKALQMTLETMRAQGLVLVGEAPTRSVVRKALRRFQRRIKVNTVNLTAPELAAELFAAEKTGDIR